jgi:hypothetical protein
MVRVGESVRLSIRDWCEGEVDAALLHALNAVDGTATKVLKKRYQSSRRRFIEFVRANYEILGPMGMPWIDLERTTFPIRDPEHPERIISLDVAEVIYKIHRCTQGHGEELPDGFKLLPIPEGMPQRTRMSVAAPSEVRAGVQLSERMIFGLLAICVASRANIGQQAGQGDYLTFNGTHSLCINESWGRKDLFLEMFRAVDGPQVMLDFTAWRAGGSDDAEDLRSSTTV